MRVSVQFHGYLKKLCPDNCVVEVSSVLEALKAVSAQRRELKRVDVNTGRHRVKVVGFDTVEQLTGPIPSAVSEIHVFPSFMPGKGGGFLQVAIGALLIASTFFPPLAGVMATSLAAGTTLGSIVFGMGVSLVLGGLMQMLSPAPRMDTGGFDSGQGEPPGSKYLGAPKNTTANGTRIPLGYGKFRVYGHYLSFDIQATDVAV